MGVVKSYGFNYGFLSPLENGSKDIFVHESVIKSLGFRSLDVGQHVEFDVGVDEKGRAIAINVSGPNGQPIRAGNLDLIKARKEKKEKDVSGLLETNSITAKHEVPSFVEQEHKVKEEKTGDVWDSVELSDWTSWSPHKMVNPIFAIPS